MSGTGNKNTTPSTTPGANEAMVRSRFLAGRGAASSGIDPEVLQLAEGGGGTQTATPGTPSPAATPPSAGLPPTSAALPLGLRVQQWIKNAVMAPAGERDKTLGQAVVGGLEGIPAEIKKEFLDNLHGMAKDSADDEAFFKANPLATTGGMTPNGPSAVMHALGAVFAPLNGLFTSAGGRPIEQMTGVRRQVAGTLLSILAPGAAGKAGKAADVAEGLDAAAAAPKGGPPGGGGGAAAAAAKSETGLGGAPGLSGEQSEPAARAFDIEGERPGAAIKVTPELRAKAAKYINGGGAQSPIEVHLDALADDATRNAAVNDIAKIIPLDKVKHVDVTQMNAYSLNLSPDEVMSTIRPQFPSDETMYAAHMVLNSAAQEFWNVARVAQESGAPDDMEKATRAYALFNKYAGDLRDAKTDWGRAGRIQQEASTAHAGFAGKISDMIQDIGPDNVDELIRKTAQLDDPLKVAPFVSSTRTMGGRDALLYGWYNWLLSNPATVVKKMSSDATVAVWNTAVRYAAEKFGSGDVRPGEAAQLVAGYAGSMRDGLSAAAKALKEGRSQFYGDYQTLDGRVIESTANHPAELGDPENITSRAQQWARSALPTSWIGAADDFAKVINYRAEARALAFRDGMIKGLSSEDLSNHVTQTMTNVPQHIHQQAVSAALRNTFQEPLTGIAEKVQGIADGLNIPVPGTNMQLPLGRVIMPFVKVPANIAKFAYRNSVLAAALPSDAVKAELAAGGATADLARARMGLGTAASMIVLPFMLQGRITGRGPGDPQINRAWQAAGNKPYSVRVGDKWYGYNRVEPIGMHMAMLADTVDTLRYAHDEDAAGLAWSASFGIGDAMLSKTYLQGLSDFIDALHDPDERAYAGNKLVATMAVPQGAAALAQSFDSQLRAHYSMLDGIAARTPGLSTSLPPVRDLWGQPVSKDAGYSPIPFTTGTPGANMLSPIAMAPAGDAQPIDKWIWDNREAFPNDGQGRLGLTRPGQVQSFDGGKVSAQLKLTPKQLDRLRELAGNGLKDPRSGLGARDALNALVAGKSPDGNAQRKWDDASPAARAVMVLRIFNEYRDAAKKTVLAENPDMQAALAEKLNTRVQALKAPTIGGSP
jgi:hypothetical protein